MNVHTPVIYDHGIWAEHDYACPVCKERPAIYQQQTAVFSPCWYCQGDGWTVKRKFSIRRLLHRDNKAA